MDNPLRQYFRRPAIYLKLPSNGNFYPVGAIDMPENKELPVYPMTAIDEITSRTPDALFNGTAVVEIIKSCVPAIKDPWSIPAIDLDSVLIAIRAATNGNEMEVESTCPSCKEEGKYNINLVGLLTGLAPGKYEEKFTLGDLEFSFKPLDYRKTNEVSNIQFEIDKALTMLQSEQDQAKRDVITSETMAKLNTMGMNLLCEAIDSIKTPASIVTEKQYILDYLKNCDKNSYEMLRNHAIKLRQGSELKPLKVTCVNCQHNYEQVLAINPSDFFA